MKTSKVKLGLIGAICGAIIFASFAVAFLLWPAHQFALDVNPSLNITTNRLNRVTSIEALNEDGREFLDGYEVEDRHLEAAIADLVDRMILTGHISGGQDNIVMITVKNDELSDAYLKKVNEAIAAFLENKQLAYAIINQGWDETDSSDDHFDISRGKLALIQKLIDHDERLTFDDLDDISLRDLLIIAKQMSLSPQELFTKITQSDGFDSEFTQQVEDVQLSTQTVEMIGRDKAIEIALARAGGGTVVEFEYDRDDGEYEIEIKYNGYEYELEIDAYTGEILDFERDRDDDDYTESSSEITVIGRDKAIEIALAKVGGGTVVEFEYDREDGEYEIEIKYNGYEFELEIDAYTGEILDFERDRDDDDYTESSSEITVIGRDKAIEIALVKVGGGTVVEFEYDREDGEYEIEIEYNGYEYELEIDAYTGEILDFEIDD